MKISYRTHPILEKLHNGSLGVMPIHEDDKPFFDVNISVFRDDWKKYRKHFAKEIFIVSESFYESFSLAREKLFSLYEDLRLGNKGDLLVSGTYVIQNRVVMIYQTFKKDSEDIETACYVFDKEGKPYLNMVDISTSWRSGWISNMITNGAKLDEDKIEEIMQIYIIDGVLLHLFRKYAEIDIKILSPNSKTNNPKAKYVNTTKLSLTYLDSKWFTTLVKSDAFKVRGHFRLQPKKKEGEWTKELIWINDFQKEGYTAPARKLNQQINEAI